MKMNKVKLFFMITNNIVFAENLDLSLPWESNDSYVFLSQLDSVIAENIETLPNIAGILISKDGKIIFESYYNDSYANEIFPVWSVTKSFLSTIVGQAYDMQLIPDPELPLSNFLDYDIENNTRLGLGAEFRASNFDIYGNYYKGGIGGTNQVGTATERVLDGYDIKVEGQVPYTPWADVSYTNYQWDSIRASTDSKGDVYSTSLNLSNNLTLEACLLYTSDAADE